MQGNVDTLMYHGRPPWHGRGVALARPATSAEAIRAAGLDWTVELVAAMAQGLPIPRLFGVVRTDRPEPIAAVGRRYVPLQNREAFSFFDPLVGAGQAVYETAGSLDQGRRIWLLARLPGDLFITREDRVGRYLLLTNSHDGQNSLRALFTPIRVVCENTLRAALQEGRSSGIRIRHVGDVRGKAREAERLLGISRAYFDDFAGQARVFAAHPLEKRAMRQYFLSLFPDPAQGDPARAVQTRLTLERLFETGRGNDLATVRGTLWGAVNAVSELIDHARPVRTSGGQSQDEVRWKSAQFGSGAAQKSLAWTRAVAILG